MVYLALVVKTAVGLIANRFNRPKASLEKVAGRLAKPRPRGLRQALEESRKVTASRPPGVGEPRRVV